MTRTSLKWTTAWTITVVALLVLWRGSEALAPRALAQLPASGTAEGFEATEYYPEPNHTQLRWRIKAGKVQPIMADKAQSRQSSKLLLSAMQLEFFQTNGAAAFAVSAPECIYDFAGGVASSTGRLHLASGDGRLRIEGEGFEARQKDMTLNISNRVQTVLREVFSNKTKR